MYIDFDEYLPYSNAISEIFGTNINYHNQCDHGHPYSSIKDNRLKFLNEVSWEIIQYPLTDANQVKKYPTTTKCKKCIYVQNERNQIDEGFDFPP